jgi:hypothetical protein
MVKRLAKSVSSWKKMSAAPEGEEDAAGEGTQGAVVTAARVSNTQGSEESKKVCVCVDPVGEAHAPRGPLEGDMRVRKGGTCVGISHDNGAVGAVV